MIPRRLRTTVFIIQSIFAAAIVWTSTGTPTCLAQQRLPQIDPRPLSVADSRADLPLASDSPPPLDWWNDKVSSSVLDAPRWVSFDLQTVLLDTLRVSPRIQSVSRRTSVALEKIVQQDAAFDPSLLFDSRLGRTNDPVGNSLITGGPPRLIEESFTTRGGVKRTTRRGTELNLSQELGLLDSNSTFFEPADQGNSRLSLSLTQPLLSRGGQVYNERLLTQARIDGSVSWQEMRGEVEKRIADVIKAYWRLYELRCHLMQQNELLKRGQRIEEILQARHDFDSARIEMAKARGRVARRQDRQVQVIAEIKKQQTQLAALVGADELTLGGGQLEMIPMFGSDLRPIAFGLRDAVLQGIENRPEVRAATAELESAALSIRVTRAELLPQLTAVVDTYLSGLNGNNNVLNSFTDQFTQGGPGLSAGVQYDLPYGRRAQRSRHREAHHLYQQKSEELKEAIQLTRAEIETAVITVNTAMTQLNTKRRSLVTSLEEEAVLTRRWEMMGGDGGAVGTVLENLLDSQQRRADAEREWTSAQTRYRTALIELQRAMGTLLTREGIEPVQTTGNNSIEFIQTIGDRPWQPTEIDPQLSEQQSAALIQEGLNR